MTPISIPEDPDVPAIREMCRGLAQTHSVSFCGFEEGERKYCEGRVE